jgi:hypothetical protein
MTEPAFDYDDLDAPLTVDDYIEIVADTIDEAVDRLEHGEIERLCAAIRAKIGAILQENRKWRPDKPASETDRDPNDRWWDR